MKFLKRFLPALLLPLLLTVSARAALPPEIRISGPASGTVTAVSPAKEDRLLLARFDPGADRLRSFYTAAASEGIRFPLDGSDVLLRAYHVDENTRPRGDSGSCLLLTKSGGVYEGGEYDSVIAAASVGTGSVTLKNARIAGDITILAAGGTECVKLENCTLGGRIIDAAADRWTYAAGVTNFSVVHMAVDREAVADFAVVNYNAASAALLRAPFWSADASGNTDVPAAYPWYGALVTNVLQAMCVTADDRDGTGSVFDRYASDTCKEQVAALIRESTADGGAVAGVGRSVPVSPGTGVNVDCTRFPLRERTLYAFLSAAHTPTGSADAFRAAYPITLPDSVPPAGTALESALHMDTETDGTGVTRTLDTVSGAVSLTFDEYLYHLDTASTPPALYQIDRGPADSPLRQKGWISLGSLIQSRSDSVSPVLEETLVNQSALTIDIRFEKARPGDYITFGAGLCDQYGNTRETPLSVRLRVDQERRVVRLDEQGEPVYGLVSVPGVEITAAWDGRNS